MILIKKRCGKIPYSVVVNMMECDIVVSEFELQSRN